MQFFPYSSPKLLEDSLEYTHLQVSDEFLDLLMRQTNWQSRVLIETINWLVLHHKGKFLLLCDLKINLGGWHLQHLQLVMLHYITN